MITICNQTRPFKTFSSDFLVENRWNKQFTWLYKQLCFGVSQKGLLYVVIPHLPIYVTTLFADTYAINKISFHSDEVKIIDSVAEPYIHPNATHGDFIGAEKKECNSTKPNAANASLR